MLRRRVHRRMRNGIRVELQQSADYLYSLKQLMLLRVWRAKPEWHEIGIWPTPFGIRNCVIRTLVKG